MVYGVGRYSTVPEWIDGASAVKRHYRTVHSSPTRKRPTYIPIITVPVLDNEALCTLQVQVLHRESFIQHSKTGS